MRAVTGLFLLITVAAVSMGASLLALNQTASWRAEAESKEAQAQARLENVRSRIAALESSEMGNNTLSAIAFPASDETSAEVQLQDRLFGLAAAHGFSPLNFGPAPPPSNTSLSTVAYDMEFEAGHSSIVAFLEELESTTPAIGISDLWIRQLPSGALGETETPVFMRLTAWGFWQDVSSVVERN